MGATLYWTCDVPGCTAEARQVGIVSDYVSFLPEGWVKLTVTETLRPRAGTTSNSQDVWIICPSHLAAIRQVVRAKPQGEQD